MATLEQELGTRVDPVGILGDNTLGRLSDEERRIAAVQHHPKKNLILEREAEICLGDFQIYATLRVYGTFHRFYEGQREYRGGPLISPPEPAHFEIDSVTLQGSEVVEIDITEAVSEAAMERIHEAAMESRE